MKTERLLALRIMEDKCHNEFEIISDDPATVTPKYEHSNGPVLVSFQGCVQYKQFEFPSFTLKILNSDNSCALHDKTIICVENFITKDGILFVIGRKYRKMEDFFWNLVSHHY